MIIMLNNPVLTQLSKTLNTNLNDNEIFPSSLTRVLSLPHSLSSMSLETGKVLIALQAFHADPESASLLSTHAFD